MPSDRMDHQLYKIYADNIPLFNGEEHILPSYIRTCEELITSFQNVQQPNSPVNKLIISTVISKLRGHAAKIVCPRTELNSWALIKSTLTNTFSDARNVDCLINDLITTTVERNETLTMFGLKLQNIRSLIISKLNESDESPAYKMIRIKHIEQLTLKTYINNLPEKIQIIVKCKDLDSIEEAINIVKEEEGDNEFKLRTQSQKPPQNNKPIPKPIPRPFQNNFSTNPFLQSYRPPMTNPFLNYPTNLQNASVPNIFPQRPTFPQNFQQNPQTNSQRNLQPNFHQSYFQRPMQSNYPNFVNRPTFNTRSNVFRPNNSSIVRNLPKPTPMDTSSSNTRTSQKPKFPSQALYNHIIEEDQSDIPQESYSFDNYSFQNENIDTQNTMNYENPNYYGNDDSQNFYDIDYTTENNGQTPNEEIYPDVDNSADQNFRLTTRSNQNT